ncbi:MAG TPA: hypothetical protein DEP53_14680 [Bacteroidetes bacterium]|nr:hypothetical protein [Bacteroidota bacterium]
MLFRVKAESWLRDGCTWGTSFPWKVLFKMLYRRVHGRDKWKGKAEKVPKRSLVLNVGARIRIPFGNLISNSFFS